MTSGFAGGLRSDFKLRTENMMVNFNDIMETITMIQEENLDIRTITMGISLLDCADSDIDVSCQKIYDKITAKAARLVEVGESIEKNTVFPSSINASA